MRRSAALWSWFKLMFFILKTILCAALTDRIWVHMLHPSQQGVFAVLMSPSGCTSGGLRQDCWDNRKGQLSFLKPEEKLDSSRLLNIKHLSMWSIMNRFSVRDWILSNKNVDPQWVWELIETEMLGCYKWRPYRELQISLQWDCTRKHWSTLSLSTC